MEFFVKFSFEILRDNFGTCIQRGKNPLAKFKIKTFYVLFIFIHFNLNSDVSAVSQGKLINKFLHAKFTSSAQPSPFS